MASKPSSKPLPSWLTWSGLFLGGLFFIWIPIEDVDTRYVIPLSIGLCSWLAVRYVWLHPPASPLALPLTGAAAGLGVVLLTMFLMAFKGGLHGHGFGDFTLFQVKYVLRSIPWWALIGAALGFIAGRLIQQRGSPKSG